MTENNDLRQAAIEALANYMHHELAETVEKFGVNASLLLPFYRDTSDELMASLDRAIFATQKIISAVA